MAVAGPLEIVVVLACTRSLTPLVEAWAQRIVLRGHAEWTRTTTAVLTGIQAAGQEARGAEAWAPMAPASAGGPS